MAAPTVSTVNPGFAWTGGTVTIAGAHFTGATRVELVQTDPGHVFPDVPADAPSFTVVDDTTITAVTPHFDNGDSYCAWRVTTPGGVGSSVPTFFYRGPVFESVTISPDPATVAADGTAQMTGTADYLYDGTVDLDGGGWWSSSDVTVATVNSGLWSSGVVTGRTPGTCTITVELQARTYDYPEPPPTVTDTVTLTVTGPSTPPPPPEGRFHLAFDDPTLEPYPTWTRLDSIPNLVGSYTIDRGRQYELDRTDTGRATVTVNDVDGTLDPTNPDGPYYGKIKPRMQAALCRHDPVGDSWEWRFRGFVEDFSYEFDPSQRVNRLTISLVDLFEVLAGAQMQPGLFGTVPPPADSAGQVYFPDGDLVEDRIISVLAAAGLATPLRVVFAGDVTLHAAVYSPGESALVAVQEAADGEFPGVANVFCDRQGRVCFHGRLARFFPETVAAEWGPDAWDYHAWKAGDGAAVNSSPSDTVQLREFAFEYGLAKIINSASATPAGIADEQVAGQLVVDTVSLGSYGPGSWSADSLLTRTSLLDGSDDLTETKRFASYYVTNYAEPQNRISLIGFRSLAPSDPRAGPLWQFLNRVDIADSVTVTVTSPGGGGFDDAEYFVEGIHEQVRPLDPAYDDVTLTLDLSPRAFFASNPWPD
jgi:hypothetical protein